VIFMEEWHALSKHEVLRLLETTAEGLSSKEASKRLSLYGYNDIKEEKKITPLQLFVNQFKSFLIGILIIATIVSLISGEILNSVVLVIIIFANAILGFFQEYKAEKAVEALKKITAPKAIVIRDGVKKEILAREVVPGDVIFLDEGKKVPADARLIEVENLKVDESMLTGESIPVSKEDTVLKKDVPISEMKNMVFFGTNVTMGTAKAVVVATGMKTQLGKIAKLVQKTEEETTPLKESLEKVGKTLGIVVMFVVLFVFLIGLYKSTASIFEMLLIAITLAVSAVPEGLPTVITLTLTLGMQTMAKHNAIVRRLAAVETLGTTTVICSDKTGTLTKNELTVRKIYVDSKFIDVSGIGYEPQGKFFYKHKEISPLKNKVISMLIKIGALCNNAALVQENNVWKILGDPTEGALKVLARKAGFDEEKCGEKFIAEFPFSSQRKMMSTIFKKKKEFAYVKGAPEKIIERCSHIYENNKIKKLTPKRKKELIKISEEMAKEPLRVIAFAFKKLHDKKKPTISEVENDLIFVGIAGMVDPPREGVKEAVKICREAGIKVVMITGDHKATAVSVAKQIGIMHSKDLVLTGVELDAMSLKELEEVAPRVSVYARVSPEHKVKILQALEASGNVVAMTGDGVNDAPALKRAHIGVAMGIKGTDVAKEASDMVLQDDNFATIVEAIKNGRRIFDNIKKFVRFELAANAQEVALISFAALAGLPLPLLPLQILWINLVTDTIPATTLAIDPPEKNIMKRPPRKRDENIIISMLPFLLSSVILLCFISIWVFLWGLQFGIQKARTLVFTTDVLYQLFFVFNCRTERPFLKTSPLENKYLILAVLISFGLQLSVVYVPFMQNIFGTMPLDIYEWTVVFLFALLGTLLTPSMFKFLESHKTRSVYSK